MLGNWTMLKRLKALESLCGECILVVALSWREKEMETERIQTDWQTEPLMVSDVSTPPVTVFIRASKCSSCSHCSN